MPAVTFLWLLPCLHTLFSYRQLYIYFRAYDRNIVRAHSLILTWADEVDMDPGANIYNFFASLFERFQKNSGFYKTLYKQNMSPMILNAIRKKLNVIPDTEPAVLYSSAFTAYGIFGWIDIWFSNGMKETPEELNRIIVNNINTMIKGAKELEEL